MKRRIVFIALLGVLTAAPVFTQQTAPEPTSQAPVAPAAPAENQGGAAQATPPAHPITVEQMREMFEIMHFRSTMNTMLHANLERQREQAPFIPEDVWQDFEDSFGKVDFVPVFLPVYQKYLSEEDAAKALDFYRTPAGQRTLLAMPALMQQIALAAQAKGEEIAQQVFERRHLEIEDAQKKYRQQAPSTTTPPSGESQPK